MISGYAIGILPLFLLQKLELGKGHQPSSS
jgi:hypothetical protein